MPEFQLLLKPRSGPPRRADAWYVAGGDPAEWLREIASWQTEHAKVAIVPLGCDRELTPVGAICIPPSGDVTASRRCVPFARVAPNLFIPAEADLFPQLEDAQLAVLFSSDFVHVWRPGAGLTAAEQSEVTCAERLLHPGPRTVRDWNLAQPGVAHAERLTSILPISNIDLSTLFDEGRDDIGVYAGAIEDLPKAPNEPTSALRSGARAAAVAVVGALYAISRLVTRRHAKPHTPQGAAARKAKVGKGQGAGKVGRYFAEQIDRLSRSLHEARHKELSRLLHMLDKDPEKGLRYALPFGGGSHRGRAAPTGRLTERLIDFSLRSLSGGAPADFWEVPADYQRRLQEKYRELANREIRLHRHRRAAYIFAELLGDVVSAAGALRDGKHYRESAIIYRDRLQRPLDAAKCFEEGRLWAEAIAEYTQLQMYEKIGDLCTVLEASERAAEAYHMAADVFRGKSDYISAARISEEKLFDQRLAAEDLESGWLNSAQPTQCMRAMLELFGRQGRHSAAMERVANLVAEAAEVGRHEVIASVLADAAGTYPDVSVQAAAAEGAKCVIGGRLRAATHHEVESLCRTLARLAPDDRLLNRDARRYVARGRPTVRSAVALRRSVQQPLRIVDSWSFGLTGAWQTAGVSDKTLFVAGIVDNRIVLARSTLKGAVAKFVIPWPKIPVRSDARLILIGDYSRDDLLSVHAVGEPGLPATSAFSMSDELPYSVTVGALTGTNSVFGAARDVNGITWVIEDRNGGTVVAVDRTGRLIATHRLPIEAAGGAEPVLPVPMIARSQQLYVGLGMTLMSLQSGRDVNATEMPSRIGGLVGTAPHTLNRIAVSLEVGACLIWDGAGQHQIRSFADAMSEPVLGFNRGGYVIAASGSRFEVYDTKNGKLTFVTEGSLSKSCVLAVFSLPEPDRFGLLDEAGGVTVFEIGGRF